MKVLKRQPYRYRIGKTIIKSWKKLYIQNGIYGYKSGDFFEPCGPKLHFQIEMAKLNKFEGKVD